MSGFKTQGPSLGRGSNVNMHGFGPAQESKESKEYVAPTEASPNPLPPSAKRGGWRGVVDKVLGRSTSSSPPLVAKPSAPRLAAIVDTTGLPVVLAKMVHEYAEELPRTRSEPVNVHDLDMTQFEAVHASEFDFDRWTAHGDTEIAKHVRTHAPYPVLVSFDHDPAHAYEASIIGGVNATPHSSNRSPVIYVQGAWNPGHLGWNKHPACKKSPIPFLQLSSGLYWMAFEPESKVTFYRPYRAHRPTVASERRALLEMDLGLITESKRPIAGRYKLPCILTDAPSGFVKIRLDDSSIKIDGVHFSVAEPGYWSVDPWPARSRQQGRLPYVSRMSPSEQARFQSSREEGFATLTIPSSESHRFLCPDPAYARWDIPLHQNLDTKLALEQPAMNDLPQPMGKIDANTKYAIVIGRTTLSLERQQLHELQAGDRVSICLIERRSLFSPSYVGATVIDSSLYSQQAQLSFRVPLEQLLLLDLDQDKGVLRVSVFPDEEPPRMLPLTMLRTSQVASPSRTAAGRLMCSVSGGASSGEELMPGLELSKLGGPLPTISLQVPGLAMRQEFPVTHLARPSALDQEGWVAHIRVGADHPAHDVLSTEPSHSATTTTGSTQTWRDVEVALVFPKAPEIPPDPERVQQIRDEKHWSSPEVLLSDSHIVNWHVLPSSRKATTAPLAVCKASGRAELDQRFSDYLASGRSERTRVDPPRITLDLPDGGGRCELEVVDLSVGTNGLPVATIRRPVSLQPLPQAWKTADGSYKVLLDFDR